MSDSVYGVIAYIARYWFAILVVIILWRAILWLRKDAYRTAVVMDMLPDAGFIGEWVVVESYDDTVAEGTVLNAPRDGWLGSARACDVRLKSRGIPARVARFYLRKDGLHLLPQRRGTVEVDGEPVHREAVLRHGALLAVGDITIQLRLFAGILLTGEAMAPFGGGKRRRRSGPQKDHEAERQEWEEEDEGNEDAAGLNDPYAAYDDIEMPSEEYEARQAAAYPRDEREIEPSEYGHLPADAYSPPNPSSAGPETGTELPTPSMRMRMRQGRGKSRG